ncbi:hypothetical protein HD806DRAFT_540871 [Xylariaceae sp. AK1471]|nr:hypothetical protein HD806DRAFT_540871 [Xylariaceae sp. AK1471]
MIVLTSNGLYNHGINVYGATERYNALTEKLRITAPLKVACDQNFSSPVVLQCKHLEVQFTDASKTLILFDVASGLDWEGLTAAGGEGGQGGLGGLEGLKYNTEGQTDRVNSSRQAAKEPKGTSGRQGLSSSSAGDYPAPVVEYDDSESDTRRRLLTPEQCESVTPWWTSRDFYLTD